MKLTFERENLEYSQKYLNEIETLKEGFDKRRKDQQKKHIDEMQAKNEQILELEKKQTQYRQEKEKNDGLLKQLKEIQEASNVMSTNVKVMKDDKMLVQDQVKKLKERIAQLEYELGK